MMFAGVILAKTYGAHLCGHWIWNSKMAKDPLTKLADGIKAGVRKKQREQKLADRIEGKHVVRAGTRFHVIKVDKKKNEIVVSDAATPEKVKQKFSLKQFLSKAVEIVEEV